MTCWAVIAGKTSNTPVRVTGKPKKKPVTLRGKTKKKKR